MGVCTKIFFLDTQLFFNENCSFPCPRVVFTCTIVTIIIQAHRLPVGPVVTGPLLLYRRLWIQFPARRNG